MALGKAIYLFSTEPTGLEDLERVVQGVNLPKESVGTFEELRGKLEGGQVEFLMIDGKALGARLLECCGEPDPNELLGLSLADLEKRHILRVLASTGGNKTRAARILGIDTKTLYNKLKSYQVSEKARRRRLESMGA